MKAFLYIFILGSVTCISCARQIKDMNVDMTAKGIYGASFIAEEDDTHSKFRADTLFFKRLDAADDFKKGVIIMSKVKDADGNVVINGEPGAYVIIAAQYFSAGSLIVTFFDDTIMKRTLVELKAGETKIIPETYVISKKSNLFGTVSDIQKMHREMIGEKLGFTMYIYVLGELNKGRHPDKEEQKKVEEKQKEKEKGFEEFK
jgi:hypothetical protein